ncbi:MAG TPA: choice-of-anchor D domain-containing protein, partial [Steroidobacteraceae bacterium]|nr:choice-of-anchor D domain-containing protein [Steroidobacteraceae bacterium]
SAPLPITVTNTGTASLTTSGIAFIGGTPGVFSQTNNCSSAIAPGSTCTVNVVLTPVASGYVFSNLNVTGSGGAGSKAVNVNGTGAVPFAASPASLAFGSVQVGTASTAQPVTVTNTGTVAMPAPGITFGNASPNSYSQTNNCPASIAAGSTCTISVVFTPTATGAQNASLKLRSPGEAQNVSLTGSGI